MNLIVARALLMAPALQGGGRLPSADDPVRRRSDGSIDLDHYVALARRARAGALRLAASRAIAHLRRRLGRIAAARVRTRGPTSRPALRSL